MHMTFVYNIFDYDSHRRLSETLRYRHEGGLLPVELANGVASLSTYPSARILKMFAEENFKTSTLGVP